MTAKEYLSQAYRADRMVNAKLGQVQVLRELATKASSTLSDMPHSATRNTHRMEDIIVKIVDLKDEVQADIVRLVDLKRDIMFAIKNVMNPDHQTLLELRYLCFKSWGEIAEDLRYSKDYVFELHRKALDGIKLPAENKTPQ